MKYARLAWRRLWIMPLSLFFLVTAVFLLTEIMPGDPAALIAGSFATEESLNAIRTELGLDKPIGERYASYWAGLAQGDLGRSLVTRTPISTELAIRVPASLELVTLALFMSALTGITIGSAGAYFRGKLPDRLARGYITLWQSIPPFVAALGLIFLLFFVLRWAPPPVGRLGIGGSFPQRVTGFLLVDSLLAGELDTFRQAFAHLATPALSLALVFSAAIGRTTHSTMMDALRSGQIEYARALGLSERKVVRYALLSSRTNIMTYATIIFAQVVGGSAVIEWIFAWQGVGDWGLQGVLALDVPVIQGFVLASGVIALTVFFLLDVTVMVLDPRIDIA